MVFSINIFDRDVELPPMSEWNWPAIIILIVAIIIYVIIHEWLLKFFSILGDKVWNKYGKK
ncbi:hypothetical protein JCM16418A_15600 [Paenibacillus pini]